MMGMIHVSNKTVEPFCSTGNVAAWLTKINKLVARLYGTDDLVSFLPLYRDRSVVVLYLEMEEKDQLNAEKIEV